VFSATNGGPTITSVPITSGSSSATFWYGDTTTGTPTITAAATGLTSATQQEIVYSIPASVTAVSGNGQSAVEGSAFGLPLEVQVLDQYGDPVSGAQVTFVAPSNGGPSASFDQGGCAAVLPSNECVVVTDANGIARSSSLTANGTGSYQVGAYTSASGVQTAFSLTNTPPPSLPTFAVQGPNHSTYVYWEAANAQWYGPLGVGGYGSTYSAPSIAIAG
jgi:hypothetical protein